MALPLPISESNKIMTADKHWEATGMVPLTQTYLVVFDNLMRLDSRFFLEDSAGIPARGGGYRYFTTTS
ncbi:hypothetical protein DIJ64_08000 [Mycobacterium leprae]|uniref:Uncharacterized protein n=2 Tax=Mycobacterium leprae TaxID=1769 RepID=A0AAD0KR06_MYCLR|nr:hypothetical protein DIJ64_08000 [Mycobacterium leprae]